MRCSKTYPCFNCSRFGRHCLFIAAQDSQASVVRSKSDASVARSQKSDDDDARLYFPPANSTGASPTVSDGQVPNPVAEQMYDSLFDADAEDDLMDLGLQIGRLSISERIGGLFKPGFGEHLDNILAQRNAYVPERSATGHSGNMVAPIQNMQSSIQVEPSFDLLLPLAQTNPGVSVDAVLNRTELDLLYHQYYKAVDPLAHIVHKPTFDRQFCQSFLGQTPTKSATKSFTALVMAMCFAAAGLVLIKPLQIPQCCGEISRAQSSLVGALIRLAQCAGLHRDPSGSDISPLEGHIRGLLWYQICFLDLHVAEAQGPQPMIHDSDCDTPLPLNVDDLTFEVSTLPAPSTGWTDATLSLMRYEINDIHKMIFRERIALSKRTTDLPTVQAEIEARIQSVTQKYLERFDDKIPIQRCAKLAGTSLLSRCLPMMLQIYVDIEDTGEAQKEIQSTMLARSLDMMEASATLETAIDLLPWAWYAPTYQQYHSIMLPLAWLYLDPDMPQAARASAMIDHVFGTCYGVSRQQRCADILRMLASECSAFMKLRKVKHMSSGSSRPNTTSPPNIEAAFEDVRQSQQLDLNQALTDFSSQSDGVNQQPLQDLTAGYVGAPMTMDEWWSLPDQVDFSEPLLDFRQGA
ncbi:MAG: hypothetical protein Q9216_003282 [Gyalolechia sp. 2 TL-2023]